MATCWLPIVLLVAVRMEARRREAWGAWASAVTYGVTLMGLSAAMFLAGVALSVTAWRRGRPYGGLVLSAMVAGAPVFWFTSRLLYLSWTKGP